MTEEKTLLRIYDSNGFIGYEETTEGLETKDILRMIGMLELTKMRILTHLNEEFGEVEGI